MMETTDTIVGVAIGALAAVFFGALVGLIVVCRRHSNDRGYTRQPELSFNMQLKNQEPLEVELGEVRLHPNIEEILADERWIDDATGLVPHCLAVLKSCHTLTERLATLTMGPLKHNKTGYEIVKVAPCISPRVDAVVRSMYPPLDARLLEARTTALVLSVAHLALITRYGCTKATQHRMQWVDHAMADMETHLLVLREAAAGQEILQKS